MRAFRSSLAQGVAALKHVNERVDVGAADRVVDSLVRCTGRRFTTGVGKLLQHGGAGRLNAVVAAIAGAGKAFTVVADKRAGDYTANVVGLQQFTHGFTQRVEAL